MSSEYFEKKKQKKTKNLFDSYEMTNWLQHG